MVHPRTSGHTVAGLAEMKAHTIRTRYKHEVCPPLSHSTVGPGNVQTISTVVNCKNLHNVRHKTEVSDVLSVLANTRPVSHPSRHLAGRGGHNSAVQHTFRTLYIKKLNLRDSFCNLVRLACTLLTQTFLPVI